MASGYCLYSGDMNRLDIHLQQHTHTIIYKWKMAYINKIVHIIKI